MVTNARTIEVAPGSELARLLEDPAGLPVELIKDGERYRLYQIGNAAHEDMNEDDEDYDPDDARRILRETAGAWANIDAERLIEEIYRAREEGTRPPDRPGWP